MASSVKIFACAAGASAALLCAPLAQAQSFQAGEIVFDALPAQNLPVGRCGLFLWARSAQPVFIFFAGDQPSEARVRTDGRVRTLPRTAFAGERAHGHFESQTFSDGGMTIEVDVRFDETRPIRDGAVIERGVLRISDRAGWETVAPVGGMAACKR